MTLPRRAFLAGVLAAPLSVNAQQFAGTYRPQAQPIGQGIWLVRGADEAIGFANGGAIANSVILATDVGAVVIDPGPSLAFGTALAGLARQAVGQPVVQVFVSHLHPDHAFGSGAFADSRVSALPSTRADLERDGSGFSDAMYRMLAGWMSGTQIVLPAGDLVAGPMTIGGRHLEILALSGHSAADLAILDRATGTLIAGDLVFHDRAPATPHADFTRWRDALDRLAALPHRQLVPGHGPIDGEGRALAQTRDWLSWLEDTLRSAVSRGLDMTEAGELPIPERFAKVTAARYELQRSVSHFYPRLEAEIFPRLER